MKKDTLKIAGAVVAIVVALLFMWWTYSHSTPHLTPQQQHDFFTQPGDSAPNVPGPGSELRGPGGKPR